MKCPRNEKRIFISLGILLFVAGCGNAATEERSSVQEETHVEAEVVKEDTEGEESVDNAAAISDYEYCILEDGSMKILKYTGKESVVFVPEKLEGKTVSVIGETAFQKKGEISQVVLPAGIERIEERAFEGCAALQYVFLNTGLKEIGYRAFGECPCLEEITFPKSMTVLGPGICEGCIGLEKIVLPTSICTIDENAFSGCIELKLVYGESEFAQAYAEENGKTYVDFGRIREEGNQVW